MLDATCAALHLINVTRPHPSQLKIVSTVIQVRILTIPLLCLRYCFVSCLCLQFRDTCRLCTSALGFS